MENTKDGQVIYVRYKKYKKYVSDQTFQCWISF